MKFPDGTVGFHRHARRTPQGVRGLKSNISIGKIKSIKSHPARGAWVEIGDECGIISL